MADTISPLKCRLAPMSIAACFGCHWRVAAAIRLHSAQLWKSQPIDIFKELCVLRSSTERQYGPHAQRRGGSDAHQGEGSFNGFIEELACLQSRNHSRTALGRDRAGRGRQNADVSFRENRERHRDRRLDGRICHRNGRGLGVFTLNRVSRTSKTPRIGGTIDRPSYPSLPANGAGRQGTRQLGISCGRSSRVGMRSC